MTPVLATQILRDDHKRITGLFRQFEGVDRRNLEMKQGVVREIIMEIEIHSCEEEQIFYPALLSALNARSEAHTTSNTPSSAASLLDAPRLDNSIRDHRDIENAIHQLRDVPIASFDFHDQLDDLIQLVQAHIEQEEQIVFPAAEELLADDLSPLGAQMQDLRDDLLRQPKYQEARAEFVQNPNGGEQMRTKKNKTSAA